VKTQETGYSNSEEYYAQMNGERPRSFKPEEEEKKEEKITDRRGSDDNV